MDQVGRNLSADYMVLVNAAALLFNLFLIARKRWAELAVFNIAALVNILLELVLIHGGKRMFLPDTLAAHIGATACLGWSDNGLFASIAYMNVRQFLKRDYPARLIIAVNVLYFIGLPLLSIPYGIVPWHGVQTWRTMGRGDQVVMTAALLALGVIIFSMGYRRVLARIFLVGVLMELGFEARLYLTGVRPLAAGHSLVPDIVRGAMEFKFPLAMCVAFLIIKLIWKIPELKDKALAAGQGA